VHPILTTSSLVRLEGRNVQNNAFWWKLNNKTPAELSRDWGVAAMGRGMAQHKKWEKLEAYRKYYGRGPLRYP
jgi:hypothetical protein